MKEIIVSKKKKEEISVDIESSEESLVESVPNNKGEKKNNEEKEEKLDDSFEEAKDKIIDEYVRDKYLKSQSSKYYHPCYSQWTRQRGLFTSTWVQYSDELGYAYGGADPLNYDPTTKNRFIRRVFILVLIILMVASLFDFCSSKMSLRSTWEANASLFLIVPVAVVMACLNYFMAISPCTRTTPFTHICLLLTFLGTCIISGYLSGKYNTLLVCYTFVTASFVAFGFIILANTSYDFTHWSLHIIGLSISVPFLIGFYLIAKYRVIEHTRAAYSELVLFLWIVGSLLYILVMTIMLQIILGSQAVEILENDYTLGAFYLITSIFDIHIKIVQLISHTLQFNEE